MLSRKPFGASFVIFTEFCNTATGNVLTGYDVIHRRKFECAVASRFSVVCINIKNWIVSHDKFITIYEASSLRESIHMRSRSLIHDSATWQFCKITQ